MPYTLRKPVTGGTSVQGPTDHPDTLGAYQSCSGPIMLGISTVLTTL